MPHTREEIATNLAERLCWQVARRNDSRVARRLYRKRAVDGVYQLDEGALLDDFFYFLQELGLGDWLGDVQGMGIQREMVPVVQSLLLYRLKTLFGIGSMNALPALLFSDEALMRLGGLQCAAGAAGGVPARRRQTAGATHGGAHLPGYLGRDHRAVEPA